MAKLTADEATQIVRDWLISFGQCRNIEEWMAHVTADFTEFHSTFPLLLKRKMFWAVESRFREPVQSGGPSFAPNLRDVRVLSDMAVLSIFAGESARLEADGSITYHVVRSTMMHVLDRGAWLLAHDQVSPSGGDTPYGHNLFGRGTLHYGAP